MLRWGIVGAGSIAHTFAKDLALVEGNKLMGVASRNLDKASEFAREYDAPNAFGSYDELFKSNTVDVVYIATPHTSHCALSIAAMQHKKHVLCEKPIGINANEVAQMLQTAKKEKVFLMEALWSRFNPTIRKVKHLVDSGEIGTIGHLRSDFAFHALDRDEGGRLLNPNLGGGSILDIGIYPIFLSYLMLGMPKNIIAHAQFYKTGIEVQTSMIFEYENKAQALLFSGLASTSEMKSEIGGTKGTIYIHSRWHEATEYSLVKDGIEETVVVGKRGKGYTHEIEEVAKCITNGQLESQLWSHQDSTNLISLLDAVRNKAGVTFPFET